MSTRLQIFNAERFESTVLRMLKFIFWCYNFSWVFLYGYVILNIRIEYNLLISQTYDHVRLNKPVPAGSSKLNHDEAIQ